MSERYQGKHLPSPHNYDGGGRIVLQVPAYGPSWNQVWADHVRQNFANRDKPETQRQPRRYAIVRRLPNGDSQ